MVSNFSRNVSTIVLIRVYKKHNMLRVFVLQDTAASQLFLFSCFYIFSE